MRHPSAQPSSGIVARGRETDTMVAGVSSGEGEFAGRGAAGVDDALVVVEGFFDGDGDGEGGIGFVKGGLGGVLEGCVMAFCRSMDSVL